jgi:hypothetical protein
MTGHAVLEITVPHVRLLDVTTDRGNRYSPSPGCIKPFNTGMLALSRLAPNFVGSRGSVIPQRAPVEMDDLAVPDEAGQTVSVKID